MYYIDPHIHMVSRTTDDYETLSKIITSLDNKFRLKNKKNKEAKKQIINIYEAYIKIQNILKYALRPIEQISLSEFVQLEKSAISKTKKK